MTAAESRPAGVDMETSFRPTGGKLGLHVTVAGLLARGSWRRSAFPTIRCADGQWLEMDRRSPLTVAGAAPALDLEEVRTEFPFHLLAKAPTSGRLLVLRARRRNWPVAPSRCIAATVARAPHQGASQARGMTRCMLFSPCGP